MRCDDCGSEFDNSWGLKMHVAHTECEMEVDHEPRSWTVDEEGRQNLAESKRGDKNPSKREDVRRKISDTLTGKMAGENHPRWNGGYERKYSPAFRENRYTAKKRDGRCQFCGLSRDAHFVLFGQDMDAAHMVEGDDDASALLALCRTCHRRFDSI